MWKHLVALKAFHTLSWELWGAFIPALPADYEPLIFEEMPLAEPGQVQATLLVLSVGFCSAVTDSNYSGICVDPINAR